MAQGSDVFFREFCITAQDPGKQNEKSQYPVNMSQALSKDFRETLLRGGLWLNINHSLFRGDP